MSSALVAVLVPPFLTRMLPLEAYGAWAVALQIGTYVNIFGLGVQAAVGRYVAFYPAPEQTDERDSIVASAFWALLVIALLGCGATGMLATHTDRLFPHLSLAWQSDAARATAILGLSFAVSLIGSIFGSVFLGLQQSHVPAITQLGGRVLQGGLLIAAASTGSLTIMALAHLAGSVVITVILCWLWRTRTRHPTIATHRISRDSLKELGGFCLSLTVWNLAMLLVSGLDLIILARYAPISVPFYAVSLTLVSFIAGTLQALASALTPAAAGMQATDGGDRLKELLVRASKLIAIASLLVSAPLMFTGREILTLWVGPVYADHAQAILALLAVATVIRTCLLPYGMIAIGTGQQRRMIYTPLIEGLTSLVLSLWWVREHGVMGVAAAKVASATLGIVLLIGQNALAHTIPHLSRRTVTWEGVLHPLLFWAALGALFILASPLRSDPWRFAPLMALAVLIAAIAMGCRDIVQLLRRFSKRSQVRA
ncbi:hypothetical protein ASE70_17055 [Sphingomonas sp. Leaf22]|nr:hypothetical protein ASE70_17055 [Sphingomonas sp. Leaf22]